MSLSRHRAEGHLRLTAVGRSAQNRIPCRKRPITRRIEIDNFYISIGNADGSSRNQSNDKIIQKLLLGEFINGTKDVIYICYEPLNSPSTLFTSIQNIKQGQIPDSEAYLERVKKEMEQKEKVAQGGNESFLQKYWMYIVPFVVIMFLVNLANPEGQ